jgi:hypothetical protein
VAEAVAELHDRMWRETRDRALAREAERRRRALEPDPGAEERRVAEWLSQPDWIRYWDEKLGDFRVPDGWPEDDPPAEVAAVPATEMHRMLRAHHITH